MSSDCLTIRSAHVDGHSDEITCLAFASDNRTLASGGYDKSVRLWDAQTGATLGSVGGHNRGVNCIAWLAHSDRFLVGDANHISLHSKDGPTLERKWSAHWGWLRGIAVSQDGSWFMSIGGRELKYWRTDAQEPLFESGRMDPEALAWLAGSNLCAMVTRSIIRIWDVEERKVIQQLRGHRRTVAAIAYSPDGRLLASGSDDKTVRLWDVASGSAMAVIKGHEDRIRSIAFLPMSTTLVAGDSGGAIRFWDVRTQREEREAVVYDNRERGLRAITVSADGRFLAAAGYGGTIHIWQLAPGT